MNIHGTITVVKNREDGNDVEETNILVVDDEKEIADLLEIYLISDGFQVLKAYSAKEGLRILEEKKIDLVLLDVMMPDMDGIAMCYRELNPSKPHERQEVISLKHLEINKVTHQVVCYGESIKLTPIEFDILYLLASNPGRVFGTDEIFERVWHEKFYEANNTVMVHIRRLRGKMKDDTREDKIITTVWGVGYKIEA